MRLHYGRRKLHHRWVELRAEDSPRPIESERYQKSGLNRCQLCAECPYPRHGLTCYSVEDGSCLLTDMHSIEATHHQQYIARLSGESGKGESI